MIAELQIAVRTLILADSQIAAIIKDVYDIAPDDAAFPYIQIIEGSSVPFDTMDKSGYNVTFGFQIFDQGKGSFPIKKVQSRLKTLLHNQTVEIDSEHAAMVEQIQDGPVVVQPDKKTLSAVSRFRFIFT